MRAAPALLCFGILLACSPRGHAQESSHTTLPAHGPPLQTDDLPLTMPPVPAELVDKWKGTSFGAFLAPRYEFVGEDGGVDVVFHFHAAQMAEKEWRNAGLNAVLVSAAFGLASGPYSDAFASPDRLANMMNEVLRGVEAGRETIPGEPRKLHVRRLALVSWSAGYGATARILRQPQYASLIDTVILLDGLHGGYDDPQKRRVSAKTIDEFVRFGRDALTGSKLLVITHSAIVPPDFPSAKDTVGSLLEALGVVPQERDQIVWRGMRMTMEAHAGGGHVRGFAGGEASDHIDHLHLVGEMVRRHVTPRWNQPRK